MQRKRHMWKMTVNPWNFGANMWKFRLSERRLFS